MHAVIATWSCRDVGRNLNVRGKQAGTEREEEKLAGARSQGSL